MVEIRSQVRKREAQNLNTKKEEEMSNVNNESIGFVQDLNIFQRSNVNDSFGPTSQPLQ